MSQEAPEETVLTIKDVFNLLVRYRRRFFLFFGLFLAIGILYPLTRPINYKAEATFMDRASKPFSMDTGLMSLIGGGQTVSSEVSSILKSRRLMNRVVIRLGLQIVVEEPLNQSRGFFSKIRDNIRIERAVKNKYKGKLFSDNPPRLSVIDSDYSLEYSVKGQITFLDKIKFSLKDEKGKEIVVGQLGVPCFSKYGTFTLVQNYGTPFKKGDRFEFVMKSVDQASEDLLLDFKIDSNKKEKSSLLLCSYFHRDRNQAAFILNTVLEELKKLLIEDGKKESQIQLEYLNERRDEREENLEKRMRAHAELSSQGLSTTGFMNAKEYLDFLMQNQGAIQNRMLQIDLELKRLENFDLEKCAYYDYLGASVDSSAINAAISKIRSLKQKRDAIELSSTGYSSLDQLKRITHFEKQIGELEKFQKFSQEIQSILATFDQGYFPSDYGSLLENDALASVWLKRLEENYYTCQNLDSKGGLLTENRWNKESKAFISYLQNLSRIFEIQQETIQERLVHQHDPRQEFQGVDLATAEQLYLHYTHSLDDLDIKLRETQFLIDQVNDPDVELVALPGLPGDGLSVSIIGQVTSLDMQLHDQANRSAKELERIQSEIDFQRDYLLEHLKQSKEMLALRRDLLIDKIDAIQSVELDRLHQHISMENKNLEDFVGTRIANLYHEKNIQAVHLNDLEKQMAELPEKWVSEALLKDKLSADKEIVLSLSNLVETKVLQNNLEIVRSSVIDPAIPPLLPAAPRVGIFSILGLFSGIFFGIIASLVTGFRRGIPASKEVLLLQGMHVSGSLSQKIGKRSVISDADLATLRRLSSHFSKDDRSLLLIEGSAPHYAEQFAKLLANKHERILIVPLVFDGKDRDQGPGILDVVKGEAEKATIISGADFDTLVMGKATRYGQEMVSAPLFKQALLKLSEGYDRVLFYSNAVPLSAEAESLMSLADGVAITVTQETVEELTLIKKLNQKISFLMTLIRD